MNKTLIILSFVLLASCSVKEVPSSDLVGRDGIKYGVFSQVPFTGISVRYYKKGQLHFKENFKEGRMVDGLYESYHENGQLERKRNYKDGKQDGLYESYHENGQLSYKGTFKDGKRDGLYESYYENGESWVKGCYKNGEETDMSYCEK